jgi:hypothetical protein
VKQPASVTSASVTLDPVGGMLKDEGFCIFMLVITVSGLKKKSTLNGLNYLKSPEIGLVFKPRMDIDGHG